MSTAHLFKSLSIMLALGGAVAGVWVFQSSFYPSVNSEGAADLEVIESRLRDSLLAVDESTRGRIEGSCVQLLETMDEGGTWADIDYSDRSRYPWKPVAHLQRVSILAQGFATTGLSTNSSPSLLEASRKGLAHWLERDYESDNWWYNQIYVPKLVGYILLCLEEELPREIVDQGLRLMRKSRWRGMTGQNLTWVAGNEILRGCLARDPATVRTAYKRLYDELRIAQESREGIQPDGSFHQHGPYLNSGSYGATFAKDVARYLAAAWDTNFEPPPTCLEAFLHFLLDGEQWMFGPGFYDYSTWGRSIVRPSTARAPEIFLNETIVQAMRSLAGFEVPRGPELRGFLNRLENPKSAESLVGHRHFWKSDYTVHRRPGYMATLRMHSERTINSEHVNGEGGTTHHLADGATFLYLTGEEYRDIFCVWDWRKVPGITCVQDSAPLTPEKGLGVRGSSRFVGGVTNGQIGVSAMDLRTESVTARKAWFFFEDEMVCLGAGIASEAPHPVATTIEQRLLDGPVQVRSESALQEVSGVYSGEADWVFHGGVGYRLGGGQRIEAHAGPRSGRWSDIGRGSDELETKAVFQVWIDHGAGPRSATYEYRVWPGLTAAVLESGGGSAEKRTLSNTSGLQAVYDTERRVLQAVFWEPGPVETPEGWRFSVDQPCLFQAVLGATEVEFAVANPENSPLEIRMRTNLPIGAEIEKDEFAIGFELLTGEKAGASLLRSTPLKGI